MFQLERWEEAEAGFAAALAAEPRSAEALRWLEPVARWERWNQLRRQALPTLAWRRMLRMRPGRLCA